MAKGVIDLPPAAGRRGQMNLLRRISQVSESQSTWLVILVAAVFITQIGRLHLEVINGDESTFILMASSVVDGNLPYVETFDNKPPLMFFMLAGIIALFGKSLLAIRLFGDACLVISSLVAFAIARRRVDAVSAGLGVLFSIALSAQRTGQFTSTELPATAMLMVSLWLLIARQDRIWSAAAVGLLISLATLTRSNLAVVAVVFGAYFLWVAVFEAKRPGARWSLLAYILAGLVPPLLLVAVYAAADALDVLKLGAIDVPLAFASFQKQDVGVFLVNAFSLVGSGELPAWLPGVVLALVILGIGTAAFTLGTRLPPGNRLDREDMLAWLMFGAILHSMLAGGSFHRHYWLQLFPLIGLIVARIIAALRQYPVLFRLVGCVVVIHFFVELIKIGPSTIRVLAEPGFLQKSHELRAAANRIAAVRRPDDTFWAMNNHLVLWYLNAQQVSKAITHPSNIAKASIFETLADAGYIARDELQRIIDSSPTFIVTRDRDGVPAYLENVPAVQDMIDRKYTLFYNSPKVTVYRLKDRASIETERVGKPETAGKESRKVDSDAGIAAPRL